jgi:hypothetical protein
MSSNPTITVVMPAYNAAHYVGEAVRSILSQTFRDFEFIIVNDGSTDQTGSILDKYGRADKRIRLYHQENHGMIAALNRGCRLARGEYIARMDADDVSDAYRFQMQLDYIGKHPEIGIVGTWTRTIDEKGSVIGSWCPATNPKMLKWTHFFGACVAHPTVLMRRSVLERLNFYRAGAVHGEDVDLWLRASAITDFSNVPEFLFEYRIWSGGSSQAGSKLRKPVHAHLLTSFITKFLGVEPSMEAVEGLRQTRVGPQPDNLRQIFWTAALIRDLYERFAQETDLTFSDRKEVSWDAAKRIASLALQASRFNRGHSMLLFLQAVKLNYHLLHPSTILRGLERALKIG